MDDIPPEESGEASNQSSRQPVKSNAVVKYSAVNAPATFARLQFNTDLKPPPSNWLNSNAELYGLNHGFSHSSVFSSFRMANMFPDCVGEVDVVSDAENIKKLLKIPYSARPVSMMVHRVENTLLIDEFDIHKHLLGKAESEWAWLKKFFCEQILQTFKNKCLFKNNTRNALQEQSLVSKFLHYSLAEPQDNLVAQSYTDKFPLTTRGPALPEPRLEEGLPDPEASFDRKFTRNVVWTFEDIQMLLGTDMPIFGGSTRPCISLKLRDAAKPINVLTGIDYWLDNLMSNVPEVLMCYHLDGIVQKYELIKTEDLPQLPDSKFSPKVIRDVAQNILSFLKSNATKAGHTYWLFKGKNEDAVKLYDLSSLCSDSLEEKDQNPFTVPVGLLLYRVARNMVAFRENSMTQIATIRMLLKNCISLLSKEKYPEIVLSAHYMLSDVYIPCETDPSSPNLEEIPSQPDDHEEDSESGPSNSVPIRSLCISTKSVSPENKYQHAPPIIGGIEERCSSALQHVIDGLDCLKLFKVDDEGDKSTEEPKMANPSEAIPMPFPGKRREENVKRKKKDKKNKNSDNVGSHIKDQDCSLKALLCRNAETLPKWQKPDKVDTASWKKHLCSLLCAKACLVYSILIEREMLAERHPLALKHICGVLRCSSENAALASHMLFKAGQCSFLMWRNSRNFDDDIDNYPEVHRPHPIPHEHELNLVPTECENSSILFMASIACYKRSQELVPNDETLKHLGNVCNEIGNTYNNLAAHMVQNGKHHAEHKKFACNIAAAEHYLQEGLKVLAQIKDNVNTSLVICNIGRLYRLKVHHGCGSDGKYNKYQKEMYEKAVENYNKALSVLGSRKFNPTVWDPIAWELSTTLYLMASSYQESPLGTGEEAEREAIDFLLKALGSCDLVNETAKLPLYQYRAASLHYRIASLYHHSLRNNKYDEAKKKRLSQFCWSHYDKSYNLFKLLENPVDVIRIQWERLVLSELLATESRNQPRQIKYFEDGIGCIIEARPAIIQYNETDKDSRRGTLVCGFEETDEEKLFITLEQTFQRIFKALIKLCLSTAKNRKQAEKYKEAYRILLMRDKDEPINVHIVKVIDMLANEMK